MDMQQPDRNESSMQLSFHLKPAIEPPEGPEPVQEPPNKMRKGRRPSQVSQDKLEKPLYLHRSIRKDPDFGRPKKKRGRPPKKVQNSDNDKPQIGQESYGEPLRKMETQLRRIDLISLQFQKLKDHYSRYNLKIINQDLFEKVDNSIYQSSPYQRTLKLSNTSQGYFIDEKQQEIQRISKELSEDIQHKTIEQKAIEAKMQHKNRPPSLNKGPHIQKKPLGVVLYKGKSYHQSEISYKWAKRMNDSVSEMRWRRVKQWKKSYHISKGQFLSKQYQERIDREDFLQIANGIISFQNEYRCRLLLKKNQKFRQSVFKLDEPHNREEEVGKQSMDMQQPDRNESSMQLSFHLKPAIEPPQGPEPVQEPPNKMRKGGRLSQDSQDKLEKPLYLHRSIRKDPDFGRPKKKRGRPPKKVQNSDNDKPQIGQESYGEPQRKMETQLRRIDLISLAKIRDSYIKYNINKINEDFFEKAEDILGQNFDREFDFYLENFGLPQYRKMKKMLREKLTLIEYLIDKTIQEMQQINDAQINSAGYDKRVVSSEKPKTRRRNMIKISMEEMDSSSIFHQAQEDKFKEGIMKERDRVNELYRQFRELESLYKSKRDKKKLLLPKMPFFEQQMI